MRSGSVAEGHVGLIRYGRCNRDLGHHDESFVNLSVVMDREVLSELEAIASESAEATERGDRSELLQAYEVLRVRATTLAQAQGWATPEQMADQFPSPGGLEEIERLDVAFRTQPAPPVAPLRGPQARVSQMLIELSAWAGGVRLAYESLERDSRRDG